MELVARKLTVPEGKSVVVAPLGDIQWAGHKEHHPWRQLQEHIKRALDLGAWFLGTGDYCDYMSPSNRQRMRAAALYDTAEQIQDDKARELVDSLYGELLAPTKGRWLGLVEGHHWTHLLTGETTDQYLCRALQAPFLGSSALIGLTFPTHAGHRMVTLFVHHGSGGGQKVHAPLLKLENLSAYFDADILIIGHLTKQAAAPISRIRAVWNTKDSVPVVREERVYLVGAGGWYKGYQERSTIGGVPRGSYVEQKMLSPVSLGAPLIKITPRMRGVQTGRRRIRVRGKRVDARPIRQETLWEPEIRVEL